ncbi:MAG: hypothetical protein JOY70_07920 [Acidisphaera sp.]|nr:hypothetical protein [Acidisphaera sp.]
MQLLLLLVAIWLGFSVLALIVHAVKFLLGVAIVLTILAVALRGRLVRP